MQITFSNGRNFEYIRCLGNEHDYKNGYTRASIEVTMPISQTSFSEIYSILNDENAVKSITLIGDERAYIDENGIEQVMPAPVTVHEGYTIVGKISVEDECITFKLYRLSQTEIERNSAISAVDELLLQMAEEV
jgi:hypothetical protein